MTINGMTNEDKTAFNYCSYDVLCWYESTKKQATYGKYE